MHLATIDIGTNSVLLLIAEHHPPIPPTPLVDVSTITRLGQNVDHTGELDPQAIQRTTACLRQYSSKLLEYGVQHVAAVCTSAARDAKHAEAFLDEAEAILHVRPEIIAGQREATLSFEGALSGLDVHGQVGMFDIGGGSTEVVLGYVPPSSRKQNASQTPVITATHSLKLGAVRLTERFLPSDPPTPAQLAQLSQYAREQLNTLIPLTQPAQSSEPTRSWIGSGGTITTLAAINLALHTYDPNLVQASKLTSQSVARLIERLASVPLEQRREFPGLNPKRADVIVAGAALLQQVLAWANTEKTYVSDRGVRWGLMYELCRKTQKSKAREI